MNRAGGALRRWGWIRRPTKALGEDRDRQGALTCLNHPVLILIGEQEADMTDAELIGLGVDDAGELGHIGVGDMAVSYTHLTLPTTPYV